MEWRIEEFVMQPDGRQVPLASLRPAERQLLADALMTSLATAVVPPGTRLIARRRRAAAVAP